MLLGGSLPKFAADLLEARREVLGEPSSGDLVHPVDHQGVLVGVLGRDDLCGAETRHERGLSTRRGRTALVD